MTEPSDRAEIENRDPATTAVLERLIIPDHSPDFWDTLTDRLDDGAPVTVLSPRRAASQSTTARSTNRILLAAAVIAALMLGAGVFAALPDASQTQPLDAGPTGDAAQPEPATRSQLSGSNAEWFFGNQMVWADGRFVSGFSATESGQNDDSHWTSADGIDWNRENGPSPDLVDPFVCPTGYRCVVNPAIESIPFHYAEPQYEVMARAGDTLLLRASVLYSIDGVDPTVDGQEGDPGPELHPELLAAAADFDPCFSQLDPSRANDSSPYLAEWGTGGIDDPSIRLTCRQGESSATFVLDLRDHLTDEQIEKVFSYGLDTELWVERPGEPAVRVTDAPSAAFWADGMSSNVIAQDVADIASSGDRFWAASNGTVVTSSDGVTWTPVDVPTGDLQPTRIEASPGGNLALRLATDSHDWSNDRWISISHNDGSTWSTPFEMPNDIGFTTAVGPAGAAVMVFVDEGSDVQHELSLIDDDGVVFSTAVRSDLCCESVAVGVDRVLYRTDQTLDVYLLDGTLTHEAVWTGDNGIRDFRVPGLALVVLALAVAAIVIGFVVERRSTRRVV